jgi:hypothetical protein
MENAFAILSDDYVEENKLFEQNLIETEPSKDIKPASAKNKTPSYEDKIKIIQKYFGVSEICAIYLYHRRRRGVPWHNPSDPKYLEWSIPLQNALIYLDTIPGFDWHGLEFGYEEIQFIKNNIDVNKMSIDITVLSETSNKFLQDHFDPDGFTTVNHSKINITKELNRMGLLPRSYCIGR